LGACVSRWAAQDDGGMKMRTAKSRRHSIPRASSSKPSAWAGLNARPSTVLGSSMSAVWGTLTWAEGRRGRALCPRISPASAADCRCSRSRLGGEWNNTVVVVLVGNSAVLSVKTAIAGTDHGHGTVYWVLGAAQSMAARIAGLSQQAGEIATPCFRIRDFPGAQRLSGGFSAACSAHFGGLSAEQSTRNLPTGRAPDGSEARLKLWRA